MYNINRFTLFWKIILDQTLGTEQNVRKKHKKAWIIINLACNIIKSNQFEPWFIEKAAIFFCFSQFSINIKNFQIVRRNNKKTWMADKIFKEYFL